MLFVLDEMMDFTLVEFIEEKGHAAQHVITIGNAGDSDDEVAIYADEVSGVVITCDAGFTRRQRAKTCCALVGLTSAQVDAAEVLRLNFDELVEMLDRHKCRGVITLSRNRIQWHPPAWPKR